jgi:drug/metabolite transporter (DMT)-like permease
VPLWIVVFRLVGHERLGTPALAGVALGFAGVAILAHPSAHAKLWGLGLCLLSAVMWAAGSFVSARAPMPTDPFAATAYEMLAGGFLMLLPSIFTVHHFSPSSGSIEGWIYLVIFGSVVGYTAYVWLLAKAPIGLVATYAYVNPIVAITLGVAFRGEHLSWRLLLGAIVVIAAVALVVRQEPASVPAEEGVEPTGATILQRD